MPVDDIPLDEIMPSIKSPPKPDYSINGTIPYSIINGATSVITVVAMNVYFNILKKVLN